MIQQRQTSKFKAQVVLELLKGETLEEAERVIAKFIDDYNRGWILHRLHLQSPIEYRTQYEQEHPSDNTKPEDNVSHRKAV